MRLLSPSGLRAAALCGLFSLAVAASAQAQTLTLNSGDNVIVSSSGTVGVIGSVLINNNVSSYSGLNGGNSAGDAVQTSGTAAFALAGGSLFAPDGGFTDLYAGGSGPVLISGGSIGVSHGANGLEAVGSGPIIISGGTFRGDQISTSIGISKGAAVQITGGNFSSASPLGIGSGGTLYLFSKNDSPFTVTGIPGQPFSGMAYDNTSLNLASLGANQFATFGVSGTLADGEGFNVNLMGLGTIDFNLPAPAAVPEASTTVSLGLLLILGAGSLALVKRRRTVTAA